MKIAQVPPLFESVPPKMYGGTERVVSYLTEELVRQGHQVTLFGTNDSVTSAQINPVCEQAIRLNADCVDPIAWHIYQLQLVQECADEFDVIHFHNDYLHFPVSKQQGYPHITTLHGRLDLKDLEPIYSKFFDLPMVSISHSQRKPLPHINWVGNVYHGLPKDYYNLRDGEGGYLAFLGRISPEKRPDRAIEIAIKSGIPLKIAAKIDKADTVYYEEKIKPIMDHPLIEFIGEIGDTDKEEFLGNALALLFPIDWPEPFGMVVIEAMATGTPVIAFNCGSVPELITHGENGFIVSSVNEAVHAVNNLHLIKRKNCREKFETSYTSTVMADQYVKLYENVASAKSKLLKLNTYSQAK